MSKADGGVKQIVMPKVSNVSTGTVSVCVFNCRYMILLINTKQNCKCYCKCVCLIVCLSSNNEITIDNLFNFGFFLKKNILFSKEK